MNELQIKIREYRGGPEITDPEARERAIRTITENIRAAITAEEWADVADGKIPIPVSNHLAGSLDKIRRRLTPQPPPDLSRLPKLPTQDDIRANTAAIDRLGETLECHGETLRSTHVSDEERATLHARIAELEAEVGRLRGLVDGQGEEWKNGTDDEGE